MSHSAGVGDAVPGLGRLRAVMAALADVGEHLEGQGGGGDGAPDAARKRLVAAQRIELISMLEWVKSVAAAAQAKLTDAFAISQEPDAPASVSDRVQARRSVRAQIGLARRDSPHRAARHVNLAAVLVHQMPGVLAALARGHTSEWRAQLIVQETRHLSAEQRAQVDAAIADRLVHWGDGQTQREARAWACRLDPHGAAARAAKAAKDRRVSIRPAPDSMTYLTALLPVKDGVACYAALHRHANLATTSAEDHRSRGQVMADELVDRLLGHPGTGSDGAADAAAADAAVGAGGQGGDPPAAGSGACDTPGEAAGRDPDETGEEHPNGSVRPGIMLHLVMTDRTLLDGDSEPAHLIGYGPLPAPLARIIARADPRTRVWVRRLYTDPTTGDLLTTDARRRLFPQVARQFLITRDQICRTPCCGAPIAHADHTTPAAATGPTQVSNGTGRCQACNYVKEAPGWVTTTAPDGTVTTRTPTGRRYPSRAPTPPASTRWKIEQPLERTGTE